MEQSRIINMIDKMSNLCGEIAKWALLVMTFSLVIEVIMRYCFNSPTRWVSDVCEQCAIVIGAVGGAYSYLSDSFVRVDIIYDHFKIKGKAILDILTFPIVMLFLYQVLTQTYTAMCNSWKSGETSVTVLMLPYCYGRTIVFIGACLLTLQGISVFMKNIYVVKKNEQYPNIVKKEDLAS